jgi:hypothetical protein
MDGKEKLTWTLFSLIVGVVFLLYVMGFFTNMDTIRKVHFDYMSGFSFQKECKDEYTEQESSRKYAYDSLIENRAHMKFGNQLHKYIIFWVPVTLCLIMALFLKDVTLNYPGATPRPYAGYFYLGLILTFGVAFLLYKVILDANSQVQMFVDLKDKDCQGDITLKSVKNQHQVQMLVVFILLIILITFFFVVRGFRGWLGNPTAVLKPDGLGKLFFEKIMDKNYFINAMVGIWILAMIWIFKMTDFYDKLQVHILCYYPDQIVVYKGLLQNYINNEKNYQAIKSIIEQNYLRVHKTYPDVNRSNIDDYIYYLMHFKGRELETLEDTPDLIALKNFMTNIRSNTTYDNVLRNFLKWCANYFIVQFILVIYVVFHVLYLQFQGPVSYSIILGTIVVAFVLSWYSWFDTVLVV